MSGEGYPNPVAEENGTMQADDLDDTFEEDLRTMIRDGPRVGPGGSVVPPSSLNVPGQFTGIDLSSPQKTGITSPNITENPTVGSRLANPSGSGDQQEAPPPETSDQQEAPPPETSRVGGTGPTSQSGSAPVTPSSNQTGGYDPGSRNSFGSEGSNGSPLHGQTTSAIAKAKLDSLKVWSVSTYKCTRQMVQERLGKASRTVDLQLEAQIEVLRDTQRKYSHILKLAKTLTSQYYLVVQTQRSLGDAFGELAAKSPELQEEFSYNADTQKSLCGNGEILLSALNFFTSSVNTLCNKTMEDSLITVKLYESARIEYDAYRADMESLQLGPKDATTQAKLHESQLKYERQKQKFDKLRQDVAVKLKFLDENKVKVMHKQLLLFHNAIAAYFSGNQKALEATLKQFNIRPKVPGENKPSFLEQNH
ncbi:arfaptin-2-like isoform X7 [Apostichopus japonicus]|uniref:arfaptin-2-like isoform X7 n=1 Tax=Stichopus japonicus TaxID=307972 RepID=UPI003AB2CC1D